MNLQNFTQSTLAVNAGSTAVAVTTMLAEAPTSANLSPVVPHLFYIIQKAPHASGTQTLTLQGSVEETPTNWFNIGPALLSTATLTALTVQGSVPLRITDSSAPAGVLGGVPRHLRFTASQNASSGTNTFLYRIETHQ